MTIDHHTRPNERLNTHERYIGKPPQGRRHTYGALWRCPDRIVTPLKNRRLSSRPNIHNTRATARAVIFAPKLPAPCQPSEGTPLASLTRFRQYFGANGHVSLDCGAAKLKTLPQSDRRRPLGAWHESKGTDGLPSPSTPASSQ